MVPFFPNFIKLDYFSSLKQKVIDVAIGATSICFLTTDANGNRVYSIGCGETGQLGYGGALNQCTPVEITQMFDSEVTSIAVGGFHALALTKSGKLYGWGQKSKSQLGTKHRKDDAKFSLIPNEIALNATATTVVCGSLFSMVLT